jgi:hypothetical protein
MIMNQKVINSSKTNIKIKGEKIMMKSMNVVTQEAFNEKVVCAVKEYFGTEYQVNLNRILKNNDTVLFGLNILSVGFAYAPTVYLNEYHHQFLNGRLIPEIVKEIIDIYEKSKYPKMDVQINDLTNFERVKGEIVYKLINLEGNKEFLSDVPHLLFCDLAIVFYVVLSFDDNGLSSVTVRNNLMNSWGVDTTTLYEVAKINTPILLPATIRDMNQVIMDIVGGDIPDEFIDAFGQMKTGSAQDYITVLLAMLDGEEYHRTMNAFATEYYLENIGIDYGRARQITAAKAVKAHTEYYATLGHGHQVGIEKIAVKYM